MSTRTTLPLLALAVASAALAACLGDIGDGDGAFGGGSTWGGEGPGGGEAAFSPAPSRLRKLTKAQYQNSLRDLLGTPVNLAKDSVEDDGEKNGFTAIGASFVTISPRGVEQYETAAMGLAKQVMADTARRATFVGCNPTTPTDATCTRAFLTKFGRRAWRRQLTAAEVDRWVAIANDAQTKLTSFWEGLEIAVGGLLTSPHFLYRVELGEPDPDHAGALRYTSFEMASRLSYFLRNTTPDDTLLDAAERGELSSTEGVKAQASRLLSSAEAKSSLDSFFAEMLHLAPLESLTRDKTKFPAMTPTLGASMKTETLKLFDDLVFDRDTDVRELFDTNTTFVNAELANLYGVPAPSGGGFAKVSLTDRLGILGHASFLSVNAHVGSSSPTYRGKAIRERFLCESMPAPPDNVPPLPEAAPGARATARQRLEMHRKVEPCASCHKLMDPIGLGLENYDAIGAFRDQENGETIDPSGDLDGKKYAGPKDLAKLLRDDPRVGPCFARNLYRHAAGHVELPSEEPAMKTVITQFSDSGYRVKTLALAIVTSDAFRFAVPQGETP